VKGVEGLLKAGGVTSFKGSARLAGKGVVALDGDQLQARDIVIATGSAIARVPTPGAELTIDSDRILELQGAPKRLAVIGGGRVPYTHGLDVEKAGVKLDRYRIVVDEHLHTDADGVWAIGDVIGGIMLAHVASYEGVCAVENIAGHTRTPDYHAAPNCIYADPEIAHVGLGEKEAKDK